MSIKKVLPLILVGLLAACGKSEAPKTEAAAAAPAPVAAAPAPAPAADATADGGKGAELFKKTCAMCHQTGVAGAPKLGDKADWGPRIAQGKDTLYKHATEGFNGNKGAMPPKGGNPALQDDEIKAIVDFMVSKAE
ncbi:cytochrome c5 family protein [Zoogloea sp.]|uniref:c-type cytochrome n=1 Tax=Zoogloea sp. TaxID=49181 RepID=UPI0035B07B55